MVIFSHIFYSIYLGLIGKRPKEEDVSVGAWVTDWYNWSLHLWWHLYVRFAEFSYMCMYGEAIPSSSSAGDWGRAKAIRDEEGGAAKSLAADCVWNVNGLLVCMYTLAVPSVFSSAITIVFGNFLPNSSLVIIGISFNDRLVWLNELFFPYMTINFLIEGFNYDESHKISIWHFLPFLSQQWLILRTISYFFLRTTRKLRPQCGIEFIII